MNKFELEYKPERVDFFNSCIYFVTNDNDILHSQYVDTRKIDEWRRDLGVNLPEDLDANINGGSFITNPLYKLNSKDDVLEVIIDRDLEGKLHVHQNKLNINELKGWMRCVKKKLEKREL